MGGWLTVMNPREYADWLRQQGGQETLAPQGAAAVPPLRLQRLPRARRHRARAATRGRVRKPGAAVRRQRRHRRRALHPQFDPQSRKRRSPPAMRPSCRPSPGRSSEDDLAKLVAYIESIGPSRSGGPLMHAPRQRELSEREDRHPLVAADHRPQAHRAALFRLDHLLLRHRRARRDADPARAASRPGPTSAAPISTTACSPCTASSWCGSSSSRRSRRRWGISSSR